MVRGDKEEYGFCTMARKKRTNPASKFRYFYLNGELYKLLHKNKQKNIAVVHNYDTGQQMQYLWTDIVLLSKPAYKAGKVAELLGVSHQTLRRYEKLSMIRKPTRIFPLDPNAAEMPGLRMYSPEDILDIWHMMSEMHIGRPRNDQKTSQRYTFPSKAELLARMGESQVTYYQDEDGTFRPVWKAPDWLGSLEAKGQISGKRRAK